MTGFIIIIPIILICLYFVLRNRNIRDRDFKYETLEMLELETVIGWVRQNTPESNRNSCVASIARYPSKVVKPIPVSIAKDDYKNIFRIFIFDEKSKEVLADRYLVCKKLDDDILDLLGQEDMVVLR